MSDDQPPSSPDQSPRGGLVGARLGAGAARLIREAAKRIGARLRLHRFSGRTLDVTALALSLILCVVAVSFTFAQYDSIYQTAMSKYHAEKALVHAGADHLQAGGKRLQGLIKGNLFDSVAIAQSRDDMLAAFATFQQVGRDLRDLPAEATNIPHYGAEITSARRLIPIAIDAAYAGVVACDDWGLVASRLRDPLNPAGAGLTQADLDVLSRDAATISALLGDAVDRAERLQSADLALDSRLQPAVAALRANLPQIRDALQSYIMLLGVAPTILGIGAPANYLVEVMDSTELRPGGGFIGNFGILTLAGGRLAQLHIEDVDLLDGPYRHGSPIIPIPPQYRWFNADTRWGFRDSNLDADFPTSARNGEQLYAYEGGKVPLQGVVAITPGLVRAALVITGSIAVPGFNDTITADNLIARIHYHQLTSSGANSGTSGTNGTSYRKRFTSYLFEHFLAKIKEQASTSFPRLVRLLMDALRSKDVQIYLNTDAAEALLRQRHLAGAIEAPAGGDSLFFVDANIAAIKANHFLTAQLTDHATLDDTGAALHHMTLTYAWPANPTSLAESYPANQPGFYYSYMRIYAPPNAQLISQDGWAAHDTTSAFGRTVWAGEFSVTYGQARTISLTWKMPNAATRDPDGWHYTALIQREAGLDLTVDARIDLPACSHIQKSTPAGMSGAHALALRQPLTSDLAVRADYASDRTFWGGCLG